MNAKFLTALILMQILLINFSAADNSTKRLNQDSVAKKEKYFVSLFFGGNYSNIIQKDWLLQPDYGTNISGGLRIERKLNKRFAINTGLIYHTCGSKFVVDFIDNFNNVVEKNVVTREKLSYLKSDALLSTHLFKSFSFQIGAYSSYLVESKYKVKSNKINLTRYNRNEYQNFDAGIVAAIDYRQICFKSVYIGAQVRFDKGISNINARARYKDYPQHNISYSLLFSIGRYLK
jgi:hypothetical protein